jgi:hypothetical protein
MEPVEPRMAIYFRKGASMDMGASAGADDNTLST